MASGTQSLSVIEMEADIRRHESEAASGAEAPRAISRKNKALAAISSAAVTSLLMTPFDVIKTRMQTQAAPDPLFVPSSSSSTSKGGSGVACCQSTRVVNEAGVLCKFDPRVETRVSTSKSRIQATPAIGSSSGRARPRVTPQSAPHAATAAANHHMSGSACIYPDEKIATRELRQMQNSGRLSGLWDGVIKVGRAEGMRGLWRGLTPTLVMTVPSQLTYMTAYDTFRTAFLAMGTLPGPSTSNAPSISNLSFQTILAPLAAGAMARSVSATLVTPIELIRTRLQASTSSSHGFTDLFLQLRNDVRARGPRVLFRGLVPTLYRDVPFSALYFAGYETMKRFLTGAGFGERRQNQSDDASLQQKDFFVAFISGATSGSLAAVITQPFDLIKTRLQAEEVQLRQLQGATTNRAASKTTWQVWREIVRSSEGTKGLFRGLSPRVAKVAPACGVMISSFELIAKWLDDM